MTRHRCTGRGCGFCEAAIALVELVRDAGPLASDVEYATRQAERDFERVALGDSRPALPTDPVAARRRAALKAEHARLLALGLCPHGMAPPHDVTRYLPGGAREVHTCTLPAEQVPA